MRITDIGQIMYGKPIFLYGGCLGIALTAATLADSVTVTHDTQLNSISTPFIQYTNYNYGASPELNLSDNNRFLMYFDMSGATGAIESATLRLYRSGATAATGFRSIAAHALLAGNAGWIEGDQTGFPAQPGEPTWGHFAYATGYWAGTAGASTPGADYDNTPLGSATQPATSQWFSVDLDAGTLEAWRQDDSANCGMLLIISGGSDYLPIAAGEYAAAEYRPRIDYRLVIPEPSALILWVSGFLFLRFNRKRLRGYIKRNR